MKKGGKNDKGRHSGMWSVVGGDFVETVISAAEMKDKMRTFHMKHDEESASIAKNAAQRYRPITKTGTPGCATAVLAKNSNVYILL